MEKTNAHRERPVIEIGIFGGHMNNHPTGHMVLQRILNLGLASSLISPHVQHQGKSRFRFTLLALPLISDSITKHKASSVAHIINLPVDPNAAISIIEKLSLDINFFPDWQPFPDQQAMLFQAQRFAPIQICFFVRGSSCVSNSIDYYILPRELENFYDPVIIILKQRQ
jgi:predicted O-linked N-acetylglucosamine transferase (SPINDLY family)